MVAPKSIPVIGFGPFLQGDEAGKKRVAREIAEACEQVGFFYLSGHGIPQAKIDAMFRASKEFFDQPDAVKLDPELRITL